MNQPTTRKRIVVATDGSPGAAVAVEEGVWLAKMIEADVVFLAVARPPLAVLGDPYYQRALSAELARARAAIDAAIPFADERDVEYEEEIAVGTAATEILRVADDVDAEMIVVGSRGRGGVAAGLLGSVSAEVVHRAGRPVYVARSRARTHKHAVLNSAV